MYIYIYVCVYIYTHIHIYICISILCSEFRISRKALDYRETSPLITANESKEYTACAENIDIQVSACSLHTERNLYIHSTSFSRAHTAPIINYRTS